MKNFDISNCELVKSYGVFTLKNVNTTIGFVRFNKNGEVEYIFVNPISPLGSKLLKSLEKWD
jgi:hypothetical protein